MHRLEEIKKAIVGFSKGCTENTGGGCCGMQVPPPELRELQKLKEEYKKKSKSHEIKK